MIFIKFQRIRPFEKFIEVQSHVRFDQIRPFMKFEQILRSFKKFDETPRI